MSVPTAAPAPLRCFVVAIESSSDRLGAALMGALEDQTGGQVEFLGVGGREMENAGLRSLYPIEGFATLGITAVLRSVPAVLRRVRATVAAVIAARPDVLVIIDAPAFTHRIAAAVRKKAPDIPIVDYVSPTVWAWRPWRARAMRRYVNHVLALLPFEPAAHQRLGGPPCTYVGHPLIEEVAELRPEATSFRRSVDPPMVLLLPGSRGSEIRRLLGVFGEAIAMVAAAEGPMELVLPTLPHFVAQLTAATADWPVRPRIVSDLADKRAAFRDARAALAASGTVTLELALAGVPTVAAYKVGPIDAIVARLLVHVPSVILTNLVLGENIVPEFLQEECRADRLAAALAPLLRDTPERNRQRAALAHLDSIMGIGSVSPRRKAAEIVLAAARGEGRARDRRGNHSHLN